MARRNKKSPGLSTVSITVLQSELKKRQRKLPSLFRKLQSAQAKVRNLVAAIEMLGGGAGSPVVVSGRHRNIGGGGLTGRKRPKNSSNLVDALAALLKGKTMGVSEAAAKVQTAGYKTNAANFRVIVNQTLLKSDRFKKIERGQYTAV